MCRLARVRNPSAGVALLLLLFVSHSSAQQLPKGASRSGAEGAGERASPNRLLYQRAFVADDRLSALRREPDLQSQVIRRLRLGRSVVIVGVSKARADQPLFCRVAVTRRTRGWIHQSALAVQGRAGEDLRIMKLIENTSDGLDRIVLCRILIGRFSQSKLIPRALLVIGEEADRAAETLSQRARKRLAQVGEANANVSLRDYYLNDTGLDRYSKLGVAFDFNESTAEYVYEGKAYRDIVKRFSECEEARLARERVELARQKMAHRH